MARKPTDTVQLKLRFSEALRRRLEREAIRNEHSLNAEIISRLDQSFQKAEEVDLTNDTFRAAFGGPTGDLLRAFATAIWLIERRSGKKWNDHSETFLRAQAAVDHIFTAMASPVPLNAVRAVQAIESARTADAEFHNYKLAGHKQILEEIERKHGRKLEEIERKRGRKFSSPPRRDTRLPALLTALQVLHAMGMGPSKQEINDEAAKRHVEGIGTEGEKNQ